MLKLEIKEPRRALSIARDPNFNPAAPYAIFRNSSGKNNKDFSKII